jgi:surface antigen
MSTLLATAAIMLGASAANAQPYDRNQPNNDQYRNGQYNSAPNDRADPNQPYYGNGYNYGYDDGYARRDRNDRYRSDPYRHETRYDRGAYYYGSDCGSNNATGTVLGAIAGGLIGSAASRGNGGAVVGGVILGGLAGNAISSNMNCDDRRTAMSSYSQGFEGRIGERHNWRNRDGRSYGSFTPTREFTRDGNTCRDYREAGFGNGQRYNRSSTACRHNDGNWYTD